MLYKRIIISFFICSLAFTTSVSAMSHNCICTVKSDTEISKNMQCHNLDKSTESLCGSIDNNKHSKSNNECLDDECKCKADIATKQLYYKISNIDTPYRHDRVMASTLSHIIFNIPEAITHPPKLS